MSKEVTSEEKIIELGHYATIIIRPDGTGTIDGALIDDDNRPEDWASYPDHFAIDNLFGIALQHALRGIDVGSKAYIDGFNQQMNEIAEEYGDE